MTDQKAQTVLQRKAGAGRTQADGPALTPVRAVGQALARACQEQMGLPLSVESATAALMTLSDLPEALEDRSLLAILEGPGDGLGLIAVAPATLSGLIEMQTMGRISGPDFTPRKPTRTDASMCADFIDRSLAALEEQLAGTDDIVWAGGFSYASFLDDPRPLGLILEETSYRVFRLTLELGAGPVRQGGLLLALPAQGKGRAPVRSAVEAPKAQDSDQADWAARLQQGVLGAEAMIQAVLGRVTLPLSTVLQLAPGTDIPLESTALERLRIEGHGGRLLAEGRLGQAKGHRAVRLVLRQAAGDVAAWEQGAAPETGLGLPLDPVPGVEQPAVGQNRQGQTSEMARWTEAEAETSPGGAGAADLAQSARAAG